MDADGVNWLDGAFRSTTAAGLDALWILNPKIKDDVPIRKETAVRTLPVRPGIIANGAPILVCDCDCCCCAFTTYSSPNDSKERNVNKNVNVKNEKNNMFIKWLANNIVAILTNLIIMKRSIQN